MIAPVAVLFLLLNQGEIGKDDSPAGRMRAAYAKHLAAFPGDINAARILATYELEENLRPDKALTLLRDVRERDATIERLRALANRAMAESIHQRLEAGSAEKYAVIAHFRFTGGHYREAFAYYRKALRLAPDFPQVHSAIAEIYRRIGHPEWALAEARLENEHPPKDEYKAVVDHLEASRRRSSS